jgi:MFS family permease
VRATFVAVAVAVVLADSSIVTLGLPDVVRDFDTSVADVAWVLISFNLVLALAALPAGALVRRRGVGLAWRGGLALFAVASLVCALAPDLGVLVAARCLQALAGAAVVAAALELLLADLTARRAVAVWGAAGILGAAIGPALGGALTELLSWEAIFAVQVPVVALALAGRRVAPAARRPFLRAPPPLWTLAALALISAALTAALFLLVVMLIEGWRLSPAQAAGVVSIMPVAAALTAPLGRRIGGARLRAAVGAIAVAGGLGPLGLLPGAHVGWTIAPQVLIGFGLGLTLSALTEVALRGPGAVAPRAAWTIAARHAGVVLGLALLTPLFTADLDEQEVAAQRAGSALLLDARLAPSLKIGLGERLVDRVARSEGRLPDLDPAFRGLDVDADERAPLRRLRVRLTEEVKRAATQAFSRSFLAGAGLALLALLPLLASVVGRRA